MTFRLEVALDASTRLAAARTSAEVLAIAARAVHDLLRMTVAVNVRRPADDEFEVTGVVGGGEATQTLLGERYPVDTFTQLYRDEYRRADGLYFIPADAPDWSQFVGAVVIEQERVLDEPDAWKPGDMLELVLRDRHGDVLAVIVADDPADGRMPPAVALQTVALIARHAASALEAALASVEAADAQREAGELQHLSASLAAGLAEREILERAAAGLCNACGFEFALIALHDRNHATLEAVAGAGSARRVVGARVPADAFAVVMRAEFRLSDSYLVPLEAAAGIEALDLHRSSANGAGRRSWQRHTLLLPLASGIGEALGLVWVDDPRDRMLPSLEKVQRMELFARNAALLVSNARMLADARDQATRDALTELENARAFDASLAAARGLPVALGLVDIDRFKRINDRDGHLRGDASLRLLAGGLAAALPGTARAFRLGGDEFAVLAPGLEADELATLLDGVRDATPTVPFSAGVAEAPLDAEPGPALVHAADTALYAAKRAGRGRTERFVGRSSPGEAPDLSGAIETVAHGLAAPEDILAVLIARLAGSLGASFAAYWEWGADGVATCRHVGGGSSCVPVGVRQTLRPLDRRRRAIESHDPTIVHGDDPDAVGTEAAYVRSLGCASLAVIPVVVAGASIGHLELGFSAGGSLSLTDLAHASSVAAIAGLALANAAHAFELEAAYRDTIGALAAALEAKDAATSDHARALATLARAVAERLGLAADAVRDVEYAALFHDIGKIATPTAILRKPGPLTDAERAVMEEHVTHGARIVEQIGFLRRIGSSVRHSHERYDGTGYPLGLAGERIPLASRIVFACDTWHAMRTDRPYRRARSEAAALAELRAAAGSQLDPAVVAALLAELGVARRAA